MYSIPLFKFLHFLNTDKISGGLHNWMQVEITSVKLHHCIMTEGLLISFTAKCKDVTKGQGAGISQERYSRFQVTGMIKWGQQ